MKVANGSVITIVPDTFAKAGEVLKKLNEGETPDLTPCDEVATLLKTVRTKQGFEALDPDAQERLRSAAGVVNHRYRLNDDMLLNFFSEAFGATRRPTKAEPDRRGRIGEFLLSVAS